MRTEAFLLILGPPGEPKIHRSSKEHYYEGDSLAAVCKARRGVPSGSLIWHQVLADNSEGRKFASYEVGARDLTNRLRIASLSQADHNSRLICEASNDVTQVALRAILPVQVSCEYFGKMDEACLPILTSVLNSRSADLDNEERTLIL